MLCEMCGKDVPLTSRVRLEHSVLTLCPDCARFGTPVDPPAAPAAPTATAPAGFRPGLGVARTTGPRRRLEERDLYQEIGEMELVPDWNQRIRVAREALQWTPEVLGKKLNEKKSIVLRSSREASGRRTGSSGRSSTCSRCGCAPSRKRPVRADRSPY